MSIKLNFPLPFRIPVRDGAIVVSSYKVADFRIVFNHEEQEYYFTGDEKKNILNITIAQVEYSPNNNLEDQDIKDVFHFAVVNSIGYINHLIDAIRFEKNLRDLPNFTITDLPMVIDIEYKENHYSYLTNPIGVVEEQIEIEDDDICKALKILSTWDKYPEIEVVDKFFDMAKHYLAKEQFIYSTIHLQTSFEVFIRNSFRLVLLKNSATEEEINKSQAYSFRNVIEQHLAKWLKISLSFNADGPIKNWYENLYIIRNQIVHFGRSFVTGAEAYKAYDSYVEARNYISDLLVNESYLNKDGNVDLKLFLKNNREEVDYDIIQKKLIEKGMIPKDLPIYRK